MQRVVVGEAAGRVERKGIRLARPQNPGCESTLVRDDLVVGIVGVGPLDRVALVDRHALRSKRSRVDLYGDGRRKALRRKRKPENGDEWQQQSSHGFLSSLDGRHLFCRFAAFPVRNQRN
jgi:hypothetical protein